MALPLRVRAVNTAADSENKIHHDISYSASSRRSSLSGDGGLLANGSTRVLTRSHIHWQATSNSVHPFPTWAILTSLVWGTRLIGKPSFHNENSLKGYGIVDAPRRN
jgi:hypothetical protein